MRWYYACKVRKGTVFIKGIYISGNSQMAELVAWCSPEHPKENSRCASAWDDIMHKVEKVLYLSKESILQGTHAWPNLVRPNIQKKIACRTGSPEHPKDNCRYMHMRWDGIIYQRNLYFRELTHGRTGSPEHPKENSSMCVHEMILCIKYATVTVFIKGIYKGNSRSIQLTHGRTGSPEHQKKIADTCIHEMILCM